MFNLYALEIATQCLMEQRQAQAAQERLARQVRQADRHRQHGSRQAVLQSLQARWSAGPTRHPELTPPEVVG